MRRLVGLGGIALAAGWLILNAGPTLAQGGPGGNVTATVQVRAAACITISPTSFTYPPSGLSTSGSLTILSPNSNAPVVTSCSAGAQNFLVRGAAATGSGATWQLAVSVNCGVPDINIHRHEVLPTTGPSISLSTTDQLWESGIEDAQTRNLVGRLTMPCTGSNGVGTTMTLPIVVTAVVQ